MNLLRATLGHGHLSTIAVDATGLGTVESADLLRGLSTATLGNGECGCCRKIHEWTVEDREQIFPNVALFFLFFFYFDWNAVKAVMTFVSISRSSP